MTVRFQALLASLGVLWLVGQVAFMINAPAAPRQEYLWLIATMPLLCITPLYLMASTPSYAAHRLHCIGTELPSERRSARR
jgi:hypothetical protein